MDKHNLTVVTEFILMGITERPELQAPLFGLFLIIYLTSLFGNLGMIILTTVDSKLQTPMYFFLRHLATTDLGYSTAVGPKTLVSFVTNKNTITYNWCAFQLSLFIFFIISELFVLSAMAYDRCMAICSPLHYPTRMSSGVCAHLAIVSWGMGCIVGLGQTNFIFSLNFCGPCEIDHFFCDLPPVLALACGDTSQNEAAIFVAAVLCISSPFLLIIYSYVRILVAVLVMPSPEGRHKAFSTCSSHLLVVTLFFGSGSITYLRPKSSHLPGMDKLLALFYTAVTSMLNPIIYSLRNKEVKAALRKTLSLKTSRAINR